MGEDSCNFTLELEFQKNNSPKFKKMAANRRMESRIHELESEFDSESRRTADAQMNLRKSERQIKELSLMNANRKSENERLENLIAQLDCEMQKCQKQLNEAHEIAALNLTKYRKAQQELEEIEARNAAQEQEIAKAELQSKQ